MRNYETIFDEADIYAKARECTKKYWKRIGEFKWIYQQKPPGIALANPLMPGSGPLTGNDERMIYLAKQGIRAIVAKTIAPNAADVGRPCIAGAKRHPFQFRGLVKYPANTWIKKNTYQT